MKKLETRDVFAAFRVVKASGVKDELKPILKKAGEGGSLEDIGIDAILTLIEASADAEKQIYNLLANPFEMSADDVASLPLDALAENLTQLAEANDLASFFRSVSGLLNKRSLT